MAPGHRRHDRLMSEPVRQRHVELLTNAPDSASTDRLVSGHRSGLLIGHVVPDVVPSAVVIQATAVLAKMFFESASIHDHAPH